MMWGPRRRLSPPVLAVVVSYALTLSGSAFALVFQQPQVARRVARRRSPSVLRRAATVAPADSTTASPDESPRPVGESRGWELEDLTKYCESRYEPSRRSTRTVEAGPRVRIGSEHPIACQTMSTTDTRDVEASVEQIIRCAEAGADLVRLTVQGLNEAKKGAEIRKALDERGLQGVPLVADIHFHPKAALLVADAFEKIRVNPGNFADGRKTFEDITYESADEFEAERAYIEELFTPLVLKCKELNRAMRIGTNHGSLSARIMSFYGDSPRGMVESALEFAEICRKHDYHNFVFSMKASNPVVMVQAYRLLAATMYQLGWDYPLHLGVTEAGEGEDGRMKSAIGIGALLADGLGDTIRVSLTEDPEFELEPCRTLAALGREALERTPAPLDFDDSTTRFVSSFSRRAVDLPAFGGLHRDGSVLSYLTPEMLDDEMALYKQLGCLLAVGMPIKDVATSDSVLLDAIPTEPKRRKVLNRLATAGIGIVAPPSEDNNFPTSISMLSLDDLLASEESSSEEAQQQSAVVLTGLESPEQYAELVSKQASVAFAIMDVPVDQVSRLHASRRAFHFLNKATFPIIHRLKYDASSARAPENGPLRKDLFILRMGMDGGSLLVDGLGDGVLVQAPFDLDFLRSASFGLLQGSRMRNVKTEFVSCPSCGRTLFDLQEVTAQISQRTGHLPGVTIAIMGCIVNGPGEMADADFGYVGGAPGKVDLYVGKEVVKKGIPNEVACDQLIQLIKDYDRWVDPKEDPEEAPAELAAAA